MSVKTLGRDELAVQYNWIGENRPPPAAEDLSEAEPSDNEKQEEIEGFSLKKSSKRVPEQKQVDPEENAKKPILSKKDIDREVKKETLKAIKKNKAMKSKDRIHRNKNIKKSRRTVHARKKSQAHSKSFKKRKSVSKAKKG